MKVMQRGRLLGVLAVPLFMAQCAPAVRAAASPAGVDRRGVGPLRPGPVGAACSAPARRRRRSPVSVDGDGRPLGGVRQAPRLDGRAGRARPTASASPASPRSSRRSSCCSSSSAASSGSTRPSAARSPSASASRRSTRASTRSPSASCSRTRSGLGTFESLVFGGTVGSCPEAARRAARRQPRSARRGPSTRTRTSGYCLLGQLVEQRHRALLRVRRPRPAARPARHRRDAAGRHERRAGVGGVPLAEAEPQLHGHPRAGRIVGGDVGRRRPDRRLARPGQARLPPALVPAWPTSCAAARRSCTPPTAGTGSG